MAEVNTVLIVRRNVQPLMRTTSLRSTVWSTPSEYWNVRARCYEDYSSWSRDMELFNLCVRPLDGAPESTQCLDLGGGSGWVARRDNKLSGRPWTIVDNCSEFAHYVTPPVRFVSADAHHLPFGDSTFSFVLIRSVLQYVDVSRVLAETQRVLTPIGHLVVAQQTAQYRETDSDWFEELNRLKTPQPRLELRPEQLRLGLHSAGLRVLEESTFSESRVVNTVTWFGPNKALENPNQNAINKHFRSAPKSIRDYLELRVDGDKVSYRVLWSIFVCQRVQQ